MQRDTHPEQGPSSIASWWALAPEALLRELDSGKGGLSEAQARTRLARFGANDIGLAPPQRLVAELARRLRDPLVLILLVSGLAALATGERSSAAIIAAMVALSVALDELQERRAVDAARRLSARVALTARVLRDGHEARVPHEALVPGDVVMLASGSQVPADGIALAASDLQVQEALLTGEPYPVAKAVHAPAADALDAPGALFMGSGVVSGEACMLVCATGRQARMGQMAGALAARREDSAFHTDLRRFGGLILRVAVFLVLFVVLAGALTGRPWLQTLLFATALAVGITPELLPMVVTVSLSRGALRLAAEEVIVKRLAAIHDLGRMDVLCTDKTGTLTEARIALARHVDWAGAESPGVLLTAWLNSRFATGMRTSLDEALLAAPGMDAGGWRKRDELAFDFQRRCASVLLENDGELRLCTKGAPADVLARCDRVWMAGGASALTPEVRERADATLLALEQAGFRVLGVALRTWDAGDPAASARIETGLVFAGFAAFLDPPRADAAGALRKLHAQGVQVKVITGDGEVVARHVCESLGMRVADSLSGAQISALSDRALALRVRHTTIFHRADPVQKERVIRALRRAGHVVGYLGDGINDAPALHAADIGLSVDGACETARAAADLILLRHSLGVLSDGIGEGRRTFANTRKYILLGTSSNFGNMISMALAAVLLPFLPMLPQQILLNNLLYDVASSSLPLDRVESREIARPQHWDIDGIRRFMLLIGPVSSCFDLATFWVLQHALHAAPAQFQSGWFLESMATQVLAIFVIRTQGRAWQSRAHPAVVAAAACVLVVAALAATTPVAHVFGFVPVPAGILAALGGITLVYLLALEAAKRAFHARARRRHAERPPRAEHAA